MIISLQKRTMKMHGHPIFGRSRIVSNKAVRGLFYMVWVSLFFAGCTNEHPIVTRDREAAELRKIGEILHAIRESCNQTPSEIVNTLESFDLAEKAKMSKSLGEQFF